MPLQIVIGLKVFVANLADERFRRVRRERGDIRFGFDQSRGSGGDDGVAQFGRRRNGGTEVGGGGIVVVAEVGSTRLHDSSHHSLTIVRHFSLDVTSGSRRRRRRSATATDGVDADRRESVDVFPVALEIVVVMEDLEADFARIFAGGIFRFRSAVDADPMTPQIETVLEGFPTQVAVVGHLRFNGLAQLQIGRKKNENPSGSGKMNRMLKLERNSLNPVNSVTFSIVGSWKSLLCRFKFPLLLKSLRHNSQKCGERGFDGKFAN